MSSLSPPSSSSSSSSSSSYVSLSNSLAPRISEDGRFDYVFPWSGKKYNEFPIINIQLSPQLVRCMIFGMEESAAKRNYVVRGAMDWRLLALDLGFDDGSSTSSTDKDRYLIGVAQRLRLLSVSCKKTAERRFKRLQRPSPIISSHVTAKEMLVQFHLRRIWQSHEADSTYDDLPALEKDDQKDDDVSNIGK